MNQSALFAFLQDLSQHNEREWFQAHKPTYDELRCEFEVLVGQILNALAADEPALATLEPKKCIFRIYRDVRFSKRKEPYKTHFSAYFAVGGKQSVGPGYYFQLGPNGQTLMAGGIYQPEKEQLARIRQEIDYNGPALHRILEVPGFRQFYPGLEGDKLKRPPAGYPADHPDIELLKHKSFVVSHAVPDATARQLNLAEYVPAAFRTLRPFADFLRDAVEG
ncbi:TIGR02453 family protein [Hymenobacter psychrophilus]|uniref:TIGR02453 family protein n=2 Tax=Hymenobacter psychrophilus TaxID=651662 RepID=A0A1H3FLZ6_9BACT|nr:TIGR02453 family protein [Hymenobacter psychrophilus]